MSELDTCATCGEWLFTAAERGLCADCTHAANLALGTRVADAERELSGNAQVQARYYWRMRSDAGKVAAYRERKALWMRVNRTTPAGRAQRAAWKRREWERVRGDPVRLAHANDLARKRKRRYRARLAAERRARDPATLRSVALTP